MEDNHPRKVRSILRATNIERHLQRRERREIQRIQRDLAGGREAQEDTGALKGLASTERDMGSGEEREGEREENGPQGCTRQRAYPEGRLPKEGTEQHAHHRRYLQ